jgi:hypothetical protein
MKMLAKLWDASTWLADLFDGLADVIKTEMARQESVHQEIKWPEAHLDAEDEPIKSRTYGGTGTIHRTGYLDVETDRTGTVVAVWFRCQMLPFRQMNVKDDRAQSMLRTTGLPDIEAIELVDKDQS